MGAESGSHLTAMMSSMRSRLGLASACMRQNCTTFARPVRDGTDEFAHANAVSGLLDDFPARAGDRALVALEFAARQYPELILRALHDSDERARAVAHHNAAGSVNRLARHSGSTCSK